MRGLLGLKLTVNGFNPYRPRDLFLVRWAGEPDTHPLPDVLLQEGKDTLVNPSHNRGFGPG